MIDQQRFPSMLSWRALLMMCSTKCNMECVSGVMLSTHTFLLVAQPGHGLPACLAFPVCLLCCFYGYGFHYHHTWNSVFTFLMAVSYN